MNPPRSPGISDEQLRRALARRPDPVRMAADLTFIVETANRTRQRRSLPSALTIGTARLTRAAVLVGAVALLVAALVALAIVVGSRHRLPPPYGPARAGLIVFDLGGDVFVANPDGTERRQLTRGTAALRATWSPDGTAIAYESGLADGSWDVVVIGPDGSHPVTVADHLAYVGDLAWSPDSHRLAFGARLVGSDVSHLYIADADRPGVVPLGDPGLAGQDPVWSPDGTEIAFKWTYTCCGPTARPDALWLIGADGSNPHQLWAQPDTGSSGQALWNTAWSPDGKRLAFLGSGFTGSLDVYVINVDGTDVHDITNSAEDEYWPSWSPDGTRIAFPRMSDAVSLFPRDNYPMPGDHPSAQHAGTFVVVDPDGARLVFLSGVQVNSNTPLWSPDGTRLFGYVYNPNLDYNDAIAVFDPSGNAPPTTIPVVNFGTISWQRLAP